MPRIFISYRRADSRATAGRIYDRLAQAFGENNVFMDVEDIPPGVDFREYLRQEIAKADVVLVLIGSKWATILKKRRSDAGDFVRFELESALEQQKITIPVLVEGGKVPVAHDLPPRVQTVFPYLNAVQVRSDPDFNRDIGRLIEKLQQPDLLQPPPPLPPIGQSVSRPKINYRWLAAIGLVIIGIVAIVSGLMAPNNSSVNQLEATTAVAQLATETFTSQLSNAPTWTLAPTLSTTATSPATSTRSPTNPLEPSYTSTSTQTPTSTSTQTETPTETGLPSNTPPDTVMQQSNSPIVTVNRNANLRSGPGTNYPIIGAANAGEQFTVIAQTGNGDTKWYLVEQKAGNGAWVWAEALTKVYNETIPTVVTVPPIPKPVADSLPTSYTGTVTFNDRIWTPPFYVDTNTIAVSVQSNPPGVPEGQYGCVLDWAVIDGTRVISENVISYGSGLSSLNIQLPSKGIYYISLGIIQYSASYDTIQECSFSYRVDIK